jgi:transposase
MRLKAAALFAEGGYSNAEIAHRLGVSRPTISHWYQAWIKGGEAALKIGTPGLPSRLSDEQWQEIQDALAQGPAAHGYDTEFWTLERIADLIEKMTGIKYHHCYVWELLTKLGWSYQKPERAAKQRDEEAIARWKVEHWPRIKRGRRKQAPD